MPNSEIHPEPVAFAHRAHVGQQDIDELGHANNLHYLRWMLDAATAHWEDLKSRLGQPEMNQVGWVVVRHELDYFSPGFQGNDLEVITWVPSCTSVTCERCTEVTRLLDGAVLARGHSSYCVIDLDSGKPRRLNDSLRYAIGDPPVLPRERVKRDFPARPSEIRRP